MITFHVPIPGAWLRDDIANVLASLSLQVSRRDDYGNGYTDALIAVATALGLSANSASTTIVVIEVNK